MAERTTYEKAFVQVTNLWSRDAAVRRLVFSRRLARIAAELMGVHGVRLYHDQALFKEAGGGHTPWHADQYYWPLATERCCTVWLPLQPTPLEMGPLAFAPGSHRFAAGRDLQIGDESEARLGPLLEQAGFGLFEEPFDLGDASFHAGWTFHRAGPNLTPRCREAMTVIYMDAEMRLAAPCNAHQVADREAWCPGAVVGTRIETPLNPVLYEAGQG
jgi:ectoine hydroxylase-related dioxygenase (phytanoyl-CoA dioxygenase family)